MLLLEGEIEGENLKKYFSHILPIFAKKKNWTIFWEKSIFEAIFRGKVCLNKYKASIFYQQIQKRGKKGLGNF